MKRPLLILGATSAIARGTAAAFARRGHDLYLAGRDEEELARLAADLHLRHGVEVAFGSFDVEAPDPAPFFEAVLAATGGLEGVVLAVGYLGDQADAAADPEEAAAIIRRNYAGPVAILGLCANYLEQQRRGFIVGIGSVAGDRGRQSNYLYGSAKGGLGLFLQGLRNRLHPAGVQVVTVKPGFVDTAMTFGLEGMFLVAAPETVGEGIAKAVERGREVVYLPWFWRYIMLIIRAIPERLFKRLKL